MSNIYVPHLKQIWNNEMVSQPKTPGYLKVGDVTAFLKMKDSTLLKKYTASSAPLAASKTFQKHFQEKDGKCHLIGKYLSSYLCKQGKVSPTSVLENWKKDVDGKGFASAILIELSKTSNQLVLAKPNEYEERKQTFLITFNCINNSNQRVKTNKIN